MPRERPNFQRPPEPLLRMTFRAGIALLERCTILIMKTLTYFVVMPTLIFILIHGTFIFLFPILETPPGPSVGAAYHYTRALEYMVFSVVILLVKNLLLLDFETGSGGGQARSGFRNFRKSVLLPFVVIDIFILWHLPITPETVGFFQRYMVLSTFLIAVSMILAHIWNRRI